jgi:hypothetical protein
MTPSINFARRWACGQSNTVGMSHSFGPQIQAQVFIPTMFERREFRLRIKYEF